VQVVQAVQSAEAAHGAVDMLICCAGAAELGKQPAQVLRVTKPKVLIHMPRQKAMWLSTMPVVVHGVPLWLLQCKILRADPLKRSCYTLALTMFPQQQPL
jgi:NAD(P)-dependent dehydrogenase (short-subunit alcohol dehydrogenase family)